MATNSAVPEKGRGATFNPGNRFAHNEREGFDDGWAAELERDVSLDGEAPAPLKTVVTIQQARTIISHNDSTDIGFNQSIELPTKAASTAASTAMPGPVTLISIFAGARLRIEAVRQAGCRRVAAQGTQQSALSPGGYRGRRQHRSVSADRARVEDHPQPARSVSRISTSSRADYQVGVGRTRHRPARGIGALQFGQSDGFHHSLTRSWRAGWNRGPWRRRRLEAVKSWLRRLSLSA